MCWMGGWPYWSSDCNWGAVKELNASFNTAVPLTHLFTKKQQMWAQGTECARMLWSLMLPFGKTSSFEAWHKSSGVILIFHHQVAVFSWLTCTPTDRGSGTVLDKTKCVRRQYACGWIILPTVGSKRGLTFHPWDTPLFVHSRNERLKGLRKCDDVSLLKKKKILLGFYHHFHIRH